MKTQHPQVSVNYKGSLIQVDQGMKELLEILWSRNVVTLFSCEGDAFFKNEYQYENDRYRAYILLARTDESLRLVSEIMTEFPPFKLGENCFWDFEFDMNPINGLKDGRITIRFPKSDIAKLVDWLNF